MARSRAPRRLQKNPLEWAALGFSLILITAVLLLLGVEGLRNGRDQEARLEIELGRVENRAHTVACEVIIRNRGAGTAEDVMVEVRFQPEDGEPQTGELQLPFVPAQGEERGWVTFLGESVPRERLQWRVRGYRAP